MQTLIRAIIDTAALRHNLGRVREIAPEAHVMAVIKANGYGHSLHIAARALADADGLAVARLEEALALRAAGFAGRILLLEGVFDAGQLAAAAQEKFAIVVHSFEQLRMLEQSAIEGRLDVWIKVDSGMNRLGFRVEDFAEALARLRRVACVTPDPTLATHLASAEETDSPATPDQLRVFEGATSGIGGGRSIANSAAVLAWPATRHGWVRPGLMLYGVSPFATGVGADFGLRAAMTFETAVISVKRVAAGETVGYGGTWRAARETTMAVVAAGYGDGYPRSAVSGTPVLVAGRRAPLVGRVSMDMISVDVTDLPGVSVGDPVELWGQNLPVEEVARSAGTIPYTLTCGVSRRVPHETR